MAARETRAWLAAPGDFSLCLLPPVHLAEGEVAAVLETVWRGEQARSAVVRAKAQGAPDGIAEGYEYPVTMRHAVDTAGQSGTERRCVVRALRPARAAADTLRARGAEATTQMEALNQRGRGKKRLETRAALRRAGVALVPRHDVAPIVWFHLPPQGTTRSVRAYRGQPPRLADVCDPLVEVCGDATALEAAMRRLGGRG